MTSHFLDSSAVIKGYFVENGSDWIRRIAVPEVDHTLFIAQITSAEIIPGLARQMREEHITPQEMRELRLLVNYRMRLEYSIIALSSAIIQRAEDLLIRHPVRAYDARATGLGPR